MKEEHLSDIEEELFAQYQPQSDHHKPGEYVSASALVSKTAVEIADNMIQERVPGYEDDFDPYYSFKGETLAEEAFRPMDYEEIQAWHPIPETEGWIIRGHADGVRIKEDHVYVGEHKAHTNPTEEKREKAKRQGTLYLAMMTKAAAEFFEKEDSETLVFDSAPWVSDEEYPPFPWKGGYGIGGVVVAVAPPKPPPIVETYPLFMDELEEVLTFYTAKAKHIVRAVEQDDLDPALDWDTSKAGLMEFTDADPLDPDDKEALLEVLEERQEVHQRIQELEGKKAELSNKIEAFMEDKEEDKIKLEEEGYSVSRVRRDGQTKIDRDALKEEGLYEKFTEKGDPYTYVTVRETDG